MNQDDIKTFNSEIDKRLQDSRWSSEMAAAVLKKEHGAAGGTLLNLFSWIMPSLAAASIVYLFIFSSLFRGVHGNEQIKPDIVYSYMADLSDLDYNVIDDLL